MTRLMISLKPRVTACTNFALAAGILMGNMLGLPLVAQSTAPAPATAAGTAAPLPPAQAVAPALAGATPAPAQAVKPAAAMKPYRNQPDRIAKREAAYYEAVWGIADPNIKAVESGVILRFSYRVLDPQKAKPLDDKKLNPVLESPEKGVRLVIPSMEKVGQLRQAPYEIDAGKSYWMAFSNSGRLVKPGDRVDIVIGSFHARGLLVE